MVYIIPATTAKYAASFLATRCTDLSLAVFPSKFFWEFEQVVITCKKARPTKQEIERTREILSETAPMLSYYYYETRNKVDSVDSLSKTYEIPSTRLKRKPWFSAHTGLTQMKPLMRSENPRSGEGLASYLRRKGGELTR